MNNARVGRGEMKQFITFREKAERRTMENCPITKLILTYSGARRKEKHGGPGRKYLLRNKVLKCSQREIGRRTRERSKNCRLRPSKSNRSMKRGRVRKGAKNRLIP